MNANLTFNQAYRATAAREKQANAIYFDCFSGISGDMTLGRLLDLGLDLEALHEELAKLHLPSFSLTAERAMRGYLRGTLHLPEQPAHRRLQEVRAIIDASSLPEQAYECVVAEIERGWHLVTSCPTVRSSTPGWVGLACIDERMALWLLRAIVVENVSVRREGAVLFLPAGPHYRLEEEIKNVITVVAKTYHYWSEHMSNQL